jgi:hypothetical protein
MPDSLAVTLLLNYVLNAIPSGLAGYALARRSGLRPVPVVLVAALLPWVGLLVPMLMSRGRRRPVRARSGLGTVGLVALVAGVGLLVASLTAEWASLEGSIHEYGTSLSGRLGDSGAGQVSVLVFAALLVILAAGAWWHGGLRYAVPLAWLSTGLAITMIDLAIGSTFVGSFVGSAVSLTGGHATAGVWVGLGARLALAGLATAYLASLLLLAQAARPRVGEPTLAEAGNAIRASASAAPTDTPISTATWGTTGPHLTPPSDPNANWGMPSSGPSVPTGPVSDGW